MASTKANIYSQKLCTQFLPSAVEDQFVLESPTNCSRMPFFSDAFALLPRFVFYSHKFFFLYFVAKGQNFCLNICFNMQTTDVTCFFCLYREFLVSPVLGSCIDFLLFCDLAGFFFSFWFFFGYGLLCHVIWKCQLPFLFIL